MDNEWVITNTDGLTINNIEPGMGFMLEVVKMVIKMAC